jgi:hypothetical protein
MTEEQITKQNDSNGKWNTWVRESRRMEGRIGEVEEEEEEEVQRRERVGME